MRFPSTEWFEALKNEASANEETFRRLGFCDADVRIDVRAGVGTRRFVLTFRDYGCTLVAELEDADSPVVDFALAADLDVWREMVENIRQNGEADLSHTLNFLQLPGTIELVADDQGKADLFYRFSQTFQEFFNGADAVPTEFTAP
ncbi:MAG: hypothetical protein GY939_08365, partial [Actinomycetia bacterium]|nr:hypothetical protein [Actinomycetes bacterium]